MTFFSHQGDHKRSLTRSILETIYKRKRSDPLSLFLLTTLQQLLRATRQQTASGVLDLCLVPHPLDFFDIGIVQVSRYTDGRMLGRAYRLV